jgi:hypothetical protein
VSDRNDTSGNQRRAGRVCADGRGFLGPGKFSRAVEIGLKCGHLSAFGAEITRPFIGIVQSLLGARITIMGSKSGRPVRGKRAPTAIPSNPFTWRDAVEKFDQLVAGRIDDALSQEIKDAVRSLESVQVSDLMGCSAT